MTQLKLLKHQYEFCSDLTTRYVALVAGFGAGKTKAFCYKTILLAAANVGYTGAICEPTFGMIKRVLIPAMDEILKELDIPYTFRMSDMKYTIHFAEGDTTILCLSAENYRRIAGLNLCFFGCDEIDTIKKDIALAMWRMAMSRLRSGKVYQGFSSSTPEGFSFLYDFFVTEPNEDPSIKDRRLIKGKTRDNPFVPEEFIQSLLDNYPPNLIKAYLEGEFTNLTSGQIYYAFDRTLNNTEKTLKDYPSHALHVGLDFNVGKCSAIVHVIDNGTPLALDEIMGARNTEEVIRVLKQRYPKRHITIYPDASGAQNKTSAAMSDLAMLKQAGFELNYSSRNPPVRDRINSMNGMLCNAKGHRRYFINNKTCPTYVRALEQQVYNRVGEPDKAHDQDHPNDAGGYFINRTYPITGTPTARVY